MCKKGEVASTEENLCANNFTQGFVAWGSYVSLADPTTLGVLKVTTVKGYVEYWMLIFPTPLHNVSTRK